MAKPNGSSSPFNNIYVPLFWIKIHGLIFCQQLNSLLIPPTDGPRRFLHLKSTLGIIHRVQDFAYQSNATNSANSTRSSFLSGRRWIG